MVSVITVNYNNTQVTLELLSSLYKHETADVEVIVVDNASRENPLPLIQALFPQVKCVRSEKNLGFAGGNNLGIAAATGDYFFFVNNDTEFTAPIICKLVAEIKHDKRVGAVCPRLVYPNGENQFIGFTSINPLTGRNKCLTTNPNKTEEPRIKSTYVHGAAFIIPREVYEQIGNMPEHYFLYFEELDWSAAIGRMHRNIHVLHNCTLVHKESQTVGKVSELKSYFMSRNRLLFMRRNFNSLSVAIFWLYYLLIATPIHITKYFKSRQWLCIRAHVAGIVWNMFSSSNSTTLGYKYNQLNKV
jgi:hypothetical protein